MSVAVAAVLAAVLGALALLGGGTSPPVAADQQPLTTSVPCADNPAVRCLTTTDVLIRGEASYSFRVPAFFSSDLGVAQAPTIVQVTSRPGQSPAGVAILTDVSPADLSAPTGGALGARELAGWVAARPDLRAGPVRRTAVGNRDAWTVAAVPRRAQLQMTSSCAGGTSPCIPLLRTFPDGEKWDTGFGAAKRNRLTFVDVPGLGTVTIWSWHNGDDRAKAAHGLLLDSIVFLPGS